MLQVFIKLLQARQNYETNDHLRLLSASC